MRNFNRDNNRFGGGRDFKKRDFGGRGSSDRSDRFEMHQTTCSKCGNDCQVPFRPMTGKPVFCKACFQNVRGSDSSQFERKSSPSRFNNFSENRNNSGTGRSNNEEQYKKQFESLNWKLDKILKILNPTPSTEVTQKKPSEKEVKDFKSNKPTDQIKKKKPAVKK